MTFFVNFVQYGSGYIFSMLISDVIFFIATSYLIWSLIKPIYKHRKMAMILEEKAGSPPKHWLYGNLPKCTDYASGFQWLVDMTKTFPVMMNFWYSPFLTELYLHHSDSAAAYVNSGAPKNEFVYQLIKQWLGDGLLVSKGKKWQRKRRLLTPAFHYSILKQYSVVFNKSVKIMLKKWDKKVKQNIDISDDVSLMALDSILSCAMSSNTNPQEESGNEYLDAMRRCQELFQLRLRTPLYFFSWIYNLTKNGKEMASCIEILHKHTEAIIAKRKLELSENDNIDATNQNDIVSQDKKTLDFLDILLRTKDEDGKGLTDLEIRDEVDTFLFGGHDTTWSGMQWALYNFAKHPEFQEKCRKEIEDVVGDKENVEWSDLTKLVYLTMFLKESLRMYPPIFLIGRKLEEPLEIHSTMNKQEKTTIPKNASISLVITSLHKNPHLWEDPDTFDPERFNKENSSKRSAYAYLPFSAGSRNCIGQNFAMNEMKIVLAQTIRRFRLSIKSDTPESKVMRKITLQSESGVHVYIEHVK